MTHGAIQLDAVIFGGGIAGLWTLDELVRSGRSCVLIERDALGEGQTIWSQGIIHGGLKYTLDGLLTGSARAIRDMPAIWRACLTGEREPNLSRAPVRSEHCWLWRTDSLRSRAGMIGARVGLRTPMRTVEVDARPRALRDCPGTVAQLDEQVIDTRAVLGAFLRTHQDCIVSAPTDDPARIERIGTGATIALADGAVTLQPERVIFAAGGGNEALRASVGLETGRMQVRDLHMVLVRGDLPELFGHCVDGARTRATITSARTDKCDVVWQVGGEIAERGVSMSPDALIAQAQRELSVVLPGVDLSAAQWATYRAPRAEGVTAGGKRPEDVVVMDEPPFVTVWPTKLALAPRVAALVAAALPAPLQLGDAAANLAQMARPRLAAPPWECAEWRSLTASG
ncbi:MAG: FAD-dependent oxidoreductase [Phycisphaerales bacterium]|nr:FAD-dependent oxidoreductase [Phycisphaerales bacterium]